MARRWLNEPHTAQLMYPSGHAAHSWAFALRCITMSLLQLRRLDYAGSKSYIFSKRADHRPSGKHGAVSTNRNLSQVVALSRFPFVDHMLQTPGGLVLECH